jgi:hypothetical protein
LAELSGSKRKPGRSRAAIRASGAEEKPRRQSTKPEEKSR